jgi:Asp-tRNA(Asn)/Glu-tRNA(Gln) amidotransferase B subunit
MPELPDAKWSRMVEQYGLSDHDAAVLLSEAGAAEYFETVNGHRTLTTSRPHRLMLKII